MRLQVRTRLPQGPMPALGSPAVETKPKRPKTYTVDPNPDAARHHLVRLEIEIPVYGKPTDDLKLARSLKAMILVGVHSRAIVRLRNDNGTVEVPERGDPTD